MISANGGLPAHRYTPQVTQRWPRGSKPASLQPVRDGEWWNVVDREKCSAVSEGYPQETGLQAPNRLC